MKNNVLALLTLIFYEIGVDFSEGIHLLHQVIHHKLLKLI